MPAEQKKWHFGVLSFTGTGHLIPLLALAQELVYRGHRVTFFEKPKIEDRVRQAGLGFVPVGVGASRGHKKPSQQNRSIWSDVSILCFNLERIRHDLEGFLRETPAALARSGVDALIVNEIALTGPTVAQMLHLPYFIISTSVPHHFGWNGFPWYSGYRYAPTSLIWLDRILFEQSCLRVRGPLRSALDRYRQQVGLGPVRKIAREYPCLGHITQLPQYLDLPQKSLPNHFCYAGPFVNRAARPAVEFPWHRLDGRPVIYATLGTTRNVQPFLFRLIAEACQGLDAQLVISLGNRFDPALFADLPGGPIVTRYAPQLELLQVAQIVISHGGPNTVFETLMAGKPMIAIPLALDQPAIAARLARVKVAEVLPVMRLSAHRIRNSVTKLLGDTRYLQAAVAIQSRLQSLRGCERAADVMEESLERYIGDELRHAHAISRNVNFDGGLVNAGTASSTEREELERPDPRVKAAIP